MQTLQKLHLSNRLYIEQVTCHLLMPLLSSRACSETANLWLRLCIFFFSYVCVYICMCVCVCMCVYVCIYIYIYIYIMCMYICIYIHICIYMYIYIYIYTHMYIYVYIYIYLTRTFSPRDWVRFLYFARRNF